MVRLLLMLCIIGLMAACNDDSKRICETHSDLCEAFKKDERVNALVSLKLEADHEEFEALLKEQGIPLLKTIIVTDQMLVEIDWNDLVFLGEQKVVSEIELDKFYPL